jgi:hypothetical protein
VTGLVAAICWHLALGLALAAFVWGVGAGYVRGRGDALDGYPFGLLAVTAAAFLYLVSPWLTPLSIALLVPVVRVRVPRLRLRDAALAAAPVLLLPFAFGLMLHGPTETLASAANGENLWWANRIWSAAESVVPYRDLLAEGQRIIYVEGAPSYVGAALSWLPRFDAILFNTTSLPAFMLVSIVVGLRIVGRGQPVRWAPLVALVALASLTYPAFPTESPPVALALPLAFVVYRLWEQPRPFAELAVVAAVVGVDLLLTKVIALLPVGIVLGAVLYKRYWRGLTPRTRGAIAAGVAAAGALVVVALLLTASWYRTLFAPHFLPARAVTYLGDQLDTRDASKLAPTFQIVGEIALLLALVRASAFAFAGALGVSVAASWLLTGQGFYMAVGFALLFAALYFAYRPARVGPAFAIAAIALTLWGITQDISGVRVAIVLAALAWWAFAVGVTRRPRALAIAAVVAAVAWAVGGFRLETHFDSYSRADHDIWLHVHDVVPRGALVYTSLTGREVTSHEGWNNYPSIARRQLYLAGWYDGRLVAETEERDRRLAHNRAVLAGAAPAVPGSWLVLRRGERIPAGFRQAYANGAYALHRKAS